MRPNLFIIGAMKSGTTSLHNYLNMHPDIFMSTPKEPGYFSKAERAEKEYLAYLALFAGSDNTRYRGESSTCYTKLPFFQNAAKSLHNFDPKARLIYLMREPLDRAVSQFRHQIRMGSESRDLVNALHPGSEYLTNSYYAMQLRPYFKLFSRDLIFLCTYEIFVKMPQSICMKIFEWLGLDYSYIPPNVGKRYYETPTQILNFRNDSLMYRFRSVAQKSSLIRSLIPLAMKSLYDRIAPKYVVLDAQKKLFNQEINEVRKKFRTQFTDWNAELSEMTGLNFHEWENHP